LAPHLIVHDQPGITRDRISAVCTRGTQPFVLWDTGGIAAQANLSCPPKFDQSSKLIGESDVLLFLVDAKDGLSPLDQELARILRKSHKPVVLVVNKIDNPAQENLAADFASLGFEQTNSISAEHNRGISELLETITQFSLASLRTDIKPQTQIRQDGFAHNPKPPSPSRSSAAQTSANPR
jgi:GTP-binding protein